ncbi:GNAT family N-acetyltransferase [Ideonella sp. BN130291]|uniref:GNAT family N-acetyltransferase n=1 Tax=Ideonella sp. BN130291 TaxID=3112940 RepID=UPI002E255144|nr:GNAT family N-acetyltransferase [Ideonella sp. BN130291]
MPVPPDPPSLQPAASARPVLTTPRLLLRTGQPADALAVCDFLVRNRAHFARWDPPTAEVFFTPGAQAERLVQAGEAFANGSGYRYWLVLPEAPERIVGSIHFSQVARGAFHSCMLGYALDAELQGHGLMAEALRAGIAEMFSPNVNLHRVQANHRPENLRSAATLQRLGFQVEGLALQYLYIDGAWRDHVMTALLNPAFRPLVGW